MKEFTKEYPICGLVEHCTCSRPILKSRIRQLQHKLMETQIELTKTCCPQMFIDLQNKTIVKEAGNYFIWCRPCYNNDGDGHMDDATDLELIRYCPHCGTRLECQYASNSQTQN